MIGAIDQKIRDAFSRAALHYDVLSSLHKEIARELSGKLQDQDPCAAILDIGMGTGWFTRRLASMFPESLVVGIDFSSGMIDSIPLKEKTFQAVQADAALLPFKDGAFDIITSNLAYQWVSDLPEAFGMCRSSLTDNGTLCLTMFGYHTFQELFEAIEKCDENTGKGRARRIQRLAGPGRVKAALGRAGFDEATVTSEKIKVRFPDMMGLLKWIKDIGANALPKEFYLGKDFLNTVNDYYNALYSDRLGVYATFEVIWVEARK